MSRELRRLVLPALLICLALAVLVSLGNWQVRRLAWKEDLIARVEERPRGEPLDLSARGPIKPEEIGAFLEENEYRPALITGEYAPDGEVLVFTSLEDPRGPLSGPGRWVLTPLVETPSRAVVIVNRGFVPDGRDDAYDAPPAGEQTIRGLIRAPERGSWLTPAPKPGERLFFARDPQRIAGTIGLSGAVEDFYVDLDASFTPPSGLPQAGETRMVFANNHLQYAVTWYGLAAALLAVFSISAWRRLKEPQVERLTPPGERP